MRLLHVPVCVFALAVTACGSSDICDHAAAVAKDESARITPCYPPGNAPTGFTDAAQTAACKKDETSCSASDKTTLNNYLNCVDNVATPNCKAGAAAGSSQDSANRETVQVYSNAVQACSGSNNITSISAACEAAYSGGGSSSGN